MAVLMVAIVASVLVTTEFRMVPRQALIPVDDVALFSMAVAMTKLKTVMKQEWM